MQSLFFNVSPRRARAPHAPSLTRSPRSTPLSATRTSRVKIANRCMDTNAAQPIGLGGGLAGPEAGQRAESGRRRRGGGAAARASGQAAVQACGRTLGGLTPTHIPRSAQRSSPRACPGAAAAVANGGRRAPMYHQQAARPRGRRRARPWLRLYSCILLTTYLGQRSRRTLHACNTRTLHAGPQAALFSRAAPHPYLIPPAPLSAQPSASPVSSAPSPHALATSAPPRATPAAPSRQRRARRTPRTRAARAASRRRRPGCPPRRRGPSG